MSIIYYAVDIDVTDDTTSTDTSIGLKSGWFRFITGRPGYVDGTDPHVNESGTNLDTTWYEDFIVKDGFGNPSRSIDLKSSGDYGSVSGFKFTLRNNDKIWNSLKSAGIYLVGKPVRFYTVLNNKFYQRWAGIVSDTSRTETSYILSCKDTFTKIHKKFPPNEITEKEYPNASDDFLGEVMPVCLGDVPYAKLFNIEGSSKSIVINTTDGDSVYSCAATSYSDNYSEGLPAINLKVDTTVLTALDYSNGEYYLKVVAGGDTDVMAQIKWKLADTGSEIRLTLNSPIAGLAAASSPYYTSSPTSDTWYFQVIKLNVKQIISTNAVEEFKLTGGKPIVKQWSDDDKRYTDQSSIVESSDNTASPPYIRSINTSITTDGELKTIKFYTPTKVKESTTNITQSSAIDIDRTTKDASPIGGNSTTGYVVKIPDEIIDNNVSKIWIIPEFSSEETMGSTISGSNSYCQVINAKILDPYLHAIGGNILAGRVTDDVGSYGTVALQKKYTTGDDYYGLLPIPNSYYDSGNDGSWGSDWGIVLNSNYDNVSYDNLQIDTSLLDGVKNGYLSKWIEIKLKASCLAAYGNILQLRQICFAVETTVDVIDGSLYGRCKGELSKSTYSSHSVYRTIQRILEDYDGVSGVDYGNVPTYRGVTSPYYWHVGRQITSARNSYNYLKELCKQSFVAMFPKRDGSRGLTVWEKKTTSTATHNASNIIRGSIKKFDRTGFAELFNNFSIKYSWSPGHGKFLRSMAINKLDESAFPASTGDWQDYFSGLPDSGYADAKALWERCQSVYKRVKTLKAPPSSLTELRWYIDRTIYDSTETTGIGTSSSAFLYLQNLVDWTARQKIIARYSIPITDTNLTLEMLDRITFTDAIFTNGNDWGAWVVGIEEDTKKHLLNITIIIPPDYVDQIDTDIHGDIVETGTQTDTITESGTQTDTITEDGA